MSDERKESPDQTFPGTRLPKYQGLRRSQKDVPLTRQEVFDVTQREAILAAVKLIIEEGTTHRIRIKDEFGAVLHEVSLPSGVIGAVLFPSIASLIGLAAMAGKRKIVVERDGD